MFGEVSLHVFEDGELSDVSTSVLTAGHLPRDVQFATIQWVENGGRHVYGYCKYTHTTFHLL